MDADTTPKLFDRTDVDLGKVAELVADAPSRYGVPVEVTHVIIDRFLPFDQRVLVRVYASPTDGRSGGGYVSYAADGAVVRVSSRVGQVDVEVSAVDDVMRGVVSLPHGFGHQVDGTRLRHAAGVPGVSINDLTDPALLDVSGNAALNGVPVTVRPV